MDLIAMVLLSKLGAFLGLLGFAAAFALWLTPLRVYKLNSPETAQLAKKAWFYSCAHRDTFIGLAVGKWFLAYSEPGSGEKEAGGTTYAVMTVKGRQALELGGQPAGENSLSISVRTGGLWNYDHSSTIVEKLESEPWSQQKTAVEAIAGLYQERGNVVALLTGPPGAGKSKVASFLARRLGASCVVLGYNPLRPCEDLLTLRSMYKPSADRPVILCLDEVDGVLKTLMLGCDAHKHLVSGMLSLADWNSALDLFGWGKALDGFVLLLTSNLTPDQIRHEINASCVRPGRVHYYQTFEGKKSE